MGLDITAYRKLTPDAGAEVDAEGYPADWQTHVRFGASMDWSEGEWPGRAAPLSSSTLYTWAESFGFRAGSYSGYNQWRAALSEIGEPGDFLELIEFADNEGVIGPIVSAKLAGDFQRNAAAAAQVPHWQGWFASQYALWQRAFEMAADGGAVNFN